MKKLVILFGLLVSSSVAFSNIETTVVVDGRLYYISAVVGPAPCTYYNNTGCGPEPPDYARVRIWLIANHQYHFMGANEIQCATYGCLNDDYSVWVRRIAGVR